MLPDASEPEAFPSELPQQPSYNSFCMSSYTMCFSSLLRDVISLRWFFKLLALLTMSFFLCLFSICYFY